MSTVRSTAALLLTLLAGGYLTFWLVRNAPGYDADLSELDSRRSSASVAAIRAAHRDDVPVWRGYARYLAAAARGDFGKSRSWDLPVADLLRERGAVTLRCAGGGLLIGWMAAVALALAGSCRGWTWIAGTGRGASATLLCFPAPALALALCLGLRGTTEAPRVTAAVALLIFARVLLQSTAILSGARSEPHVLHARARGVSWLRLAVRHVLHRAAPSLAALLVASLPLAFSTAVPVEMVCNLPGAGQLAWLAAEKRDLPVLTGLTLVLLSLTLLSSGVARAAAPGTAAILERNSR